MNERLTRHRAQIDGCGLMPRWRASALLAVSLAALCTVPARAAPQAPGVAEPRAEIALEQGWRFFDGDAPDAAAVAFPDASWATVSVPHTWNRVGYYRTGAGGTNRAESVAKRQGIGWYRLHFTAPANLAGRSNWLEFDAASRTAQVWLNGRLLGEHRGGFSRFRLDASAALRPGQDNVLVVRVDNTQPAAGNSTADVLPLVGDFFVHGGLYRPVRLVSTAPVHFDLADSGGPGVYATTAIGADGAATVAVRARLANATRAKAAATLHLALVDRAGAIAASADVPATLMAGTTGEASASLRVAAPHLWQGTSDPYLYRLVAELRDAAGRPLDRIDQAYGLRTMVVDPDRGFLLNGQPYRLHGVGYHQDRDGKGWALSRADIEEDVATLREMGANSIRLTHYQHGQAIHEIADRVGLVVWDEIPLVSSWTLGGKMEPDPALVANARQQLIELIHQNFNHASVGMWGIANEVDFGNSLPIFLTGGKDGAVPDPMPLLHQLNALAKQQDPSRPTALATCCEGNLFAPGVSIPITATAADLGGANRYFGWYFGKPGDLGGALDRIHAARPSQPLAVTEYGAGGALSIHTDDVTAGRPDSRGRAQPEEYESYIHETALAQLEARPWLYATWLWNAFDFATTIRNEGDAQDINTKGLVAYDHHTRKDAWYFYKANWNPAPMVYIAGKRYATRAYRLNDIKVYSNLPETELLLNGRSLGVRRDCPQKVCVWRAVALDSGANALVARGTGTMAATQDTASLALPAQNADRLLIDAGALVAGAGQDASGAPRLLGSDKWVEGGTAASLDVPADYGRPARATPIAGSAERDAMASYREGTFTYRLPARPGTYKLTLWFASAATTRPGTFTVKVDGKPVLQDFQPAIPASDGPTSDGRAEAHSFTIKARGDVTLDFAAGTGPARVSLIDLARTR
ncbi:MULTISPECIES: glycoside hydrolase family 2 TIM barrel-domain containing protein [unclassified Novosphingobium]|uniref:glycoside hydrolase family 2 TIM barrel-domain containing protein n=1 Tax=unclassified Novosphingobium TaxID=2644732 RepID=UPI0017BDCDFF|nr:MULTISPECIES: glycoside hydrolase family 2 TIM barrel-domain containing protein [unclassified Novosphingobium]NMN05367.1 beta-galactosidase [Novosphingobium sp. SG919]NMN87662.1 beta-galactosidase [Novosphingobium sp. SG916]